MSKKRSILFYRKIAVICLYTSVFLLISTYFLLAFSLTGVAKVFLILSIFFLVSSILISILFWKCPFCEMHLPIKHHPFDEVWCPYCGNNLLYEKDINK